MTNLVDKNGRTIWFHGEAGKLKPKTAKSRGIRISKASKASEQNFKPDLDKNFGAQKLANSRKVKHEIVEDTNTLDIDRKSECVLETLPNVKKESNFLQNGRSTNVIRDHKAPSVKKRSKKSKRSAINIKI